MLFYCQRFACICLIIGMIGCQPNSPSGSTSAGSTTGASQVPDGPTVAYPQYENWHQFGIGTTVVRQKETSNANGKVVETETLKLIERNDKEVVVESQTLVERSSGKKDDNPPQEFRFPATFKLPASMTIEQFRLPSLKAELKGEESVEVEGQTYQAKVYQWTEVNETGPMSVRLLWAESFPGGKILQEMLTDNLGMQSVEKIVKAELIKP